MIFSTFLVQAMGIMFKTFYVYDLLTSILFTIVTYIFYKIFTNSITVIKDYGENLNISLTDSETIILYQFIMKNYSEILEGNETSFKELKQKINPNLYQQLLKLYEQNKAKYL